MTFVKLIIAILLGLLFAPDTRADSNPTCESYKDQRAILQNDKWREALVGRGLSISGKMIELYRSKDGSTFTLIYTYPNGTSCVLQGGLHWQEIEWQDPRGKRL